MIGSLGATGVTPIFAPAIKSPIATLEATWADSPGKDNSLQLASSPPTNPPQIQLHLFDTISLSSPTSNPGLCCSAEDVTTFSLSSHLANTYP